MKDTRFIELVNLYVDRQISSAETAELEAEIQASPRRELRPRQAGTLDQRQKPLAENVRCVTLLHCLQLSPKVADAYQNKQIMRIIA